MACFYKLLFISIYQVLQTIFLIIDSIRSFIVVENEDEDLKSLLKLIFRCFFSRKFSYFEIVLGRENERLVSITILDLDFRNLCYEFPLNIELLIMLFIIKWNAQVYIFKNIFLYSRVSKQMGPEGEKCWKSSQNQVSGRGRVVKFYSIQLNTMFERVLSTPDRIFKVELKAAKKTRYIK